MGAVEFFADVVAFGSVLGLDGTGGPEEVSAVMGPDFAENRQRNRMWCDFGGVEFSRERASGSAPWRGQHFSVQCHRLTPGSDGACTEAVRRAYGELGRSVPEVDRSVPYSELRNALEGRGVPLTELPGAPPGFREHWQPDSLACVLVEEGQDGGGDGGDHGGDEGRVYSIHAPPAG